MISFEKIHHFSYSYDIINRYLRFCHNHLYYKKFHIVGKENIPPKGTPTFVISNHQNGLMDALAILYLFDDRRQPIYIARGDIFKKMVIAKILRYLKIMPTFRSRDGTRNDIHKNNIIFEIAAHVLQEGKTLVIFPEAGHQAGHFLSTFKKGFPRIAFKTEELSNYQLNLQILPLNIHYSNYFNFRNELLVTVGKPFTLADYLTLYQEEPNLAFLKLNEKAREEIKNLTLDIEDKKNYKEYELLREMYHSPLKELKKRKKDYLSHQLQEDMKIVANLDKIKDKKPHFFAEIMHKTKIYRKILERLDFRNWVVNNEKINCRYLFCYSLLLFLFFPLFLFGYLHNIIPFSLPNLLKKKIKDPMLHSSLHFAVSVLIAFPLFYLLIFIIVWLLTQHLFFSIFYIFAVFALLFFFYNYKKAFIKWKGMLRYYYLSKKKNKLFEKMKQLKKELLSAKKVVTL